MSESDSPNPMEVATDAQSEVSELLGDDSGIDVMHLAGPVGVFTGIGRGAPLDYQVKPAMMEAIRTSLAETVWVDESDTPEDVERILRNQLQEVFQPMYAERVAADTAEKLADWSDYHGQEAGDE